MPIDVLPEVIEVPFRTIGKKEFWIRTGVVVLGLSLIGFALFRIAQPQMSGALNKVAGLAGTALTGGTGKAVSSTVKAVVK